MVVFSELTFVIEIFNLLFQMGEDSRKVQERENLRYIIQQWNGNRLDLFEISEPDEVSITLYIFYSYL